MLVATCTDFISVSNSASTEYACVLHHCDAAWQPLEKSNSCLVRIPELAFIKPFCTFPQPAAIHMHTGKAPKLALATYFAHPALLMHIGKAFCCKRLHQSLWAVAQQALHCLDVLTVVAIFFAKTAFDPNNFVLK